MSDQNFLKVLIACGDTNLQTRTEAEKALQGFAQNNLPLYLVNLVVELGNEKSDVKVRQMAGILLKNALSSKDEQTTQQLAQQWLSVSNDVKNQVKVQVLKSIHSTQKEVRHVSAQVLSRLCIIELEKNSWGDVLDELIKNVVNPPTEYGMESSCLALGYLCEESRADILVAKANDILTALVQGMRSTINEIRFAGISSFSLALDYFKGNFQNKNERDFIMKVICECTQANDEKIRHAAMESLAKIADFYYQFLGAYMEALIQITFKSASQDKEEVALQAIEFWSTICDVENAILEDIEYAQENGVEPKEPCQNYIASSLKYKLVDLLTSCLTKQDEFQTEEDWNISASASTCLSLATQVVGKDIVPFSMEFISKNINSENWRLKEAATLAFSAILEVPSSDEMNTLVDQAINMMLKHITDPVELVKDTTVFTIGRIALFHHSVISEKHLENVIKGLLHATQDVSRISSKSCWAINNIAEQYEPLPEQQSYPLSKYFDVLASTLLKVSERSDVSENNLRVNVYAALSSLIDSSTPDVYKTLQQIFTIFCQRLSGTLKQGTLSSEEREELYLVQGLICQCIQTLTNKLGSAIKPYADDLMNLLLTLISQGTPAIDDAFLAVDAVVDALGVEFERYLKPFMALLIKGISNYRDEHLCLTCVSIVVDVCTAVGDKLEPYTDDLITALLNNLLIKDISKDIKPPVIGCFGDIAMALKGKFEKYLQQVTIVLKQAGEAKVDPTNEELIDYVNLLRENILNSYTGMLQGLKKDKPQSFIPYVDNLLYFLNGISNDKTMDQGVFKSAVNVLGDLANVYGSKIKPLLQQNVFVAMVKEAMSSNDPETVQAGKWAYSQYNQ
eukprot:gene9376-1587_t